MSISKMFYAIYSPMSSLIFPKSDFIFEDLKEASQALKKHEGSRMKSFPTKEAAERFIENPELDGSFMDLSFRNVTIEELPLVDALQALNLGSLGPLKSKTPDKKEIKDNNVDLEPEKRNTNEFRTPEPGQLTILRRKIESDDYEAVEEMIWANPKYLITVSDSAVYLMAGPKYNACHIAARSNRPEITALILDTVSNTNFVKKLYPNERDSNIQDRVNHLLDSYLNTPDPRQGNTPLQFACKLGHQGVVRVLLTFEGCDQTIRDSQGRLAEDCICLQKNCDDTELKQKIKDMFKMKFSLPCHRDQLKKRLSLVKRSSKGGDFSDSDNSFSDNSFISPKKASKPKPSQPQTDDS